VFPRGRVIYIPPVISPFLTRFAGILASSVLLGLLAALTACQKSGSQPVVLAQVEDSKLTLAELRETFPAEYEKVLPREQYLDVIQRWIDDEAVYLEALERKLDEDPQIRRKLERLRRRMIIEEFLARETGGGADAEPDEGAMTRYYENNKADFLRKGPEFRYLHIRLNTLKEALAVRSKVRGDNFATLAAQSSLDSTPDLSEPPFRKAAEVPPCLHDVLDARPGWLSSPVSCPDGVYLVKLLDRIEAGTPLPFHEVRAAIAARLSMHHRERMRESKIRQYKEGVTISLNVDEIPGQEGVDAPTMDDGTEDSSDERLEPGE
jgi:parvulin-like peptidyl-prolyl isomerase